MKKLDNPREMFSPAKFCSLLILVCWLPVVSGAPDTAYVIDKLLVGVHQNKDLDSAIIKVLPTGTALEVLRREGELVYIQDPDNVRGWVDSAYVTGDRPAQIRVAELEKEKVSLELRIKTLEQAPRAAPANVDSDADLRAAEAQIEAFTKENTELKGKLSGERLRAGKYQSELATLRTQVKRAAVPLDVRLAELERARDGLEIALDDAQKQIEKLEARSSKEDVSALVPMVLESYATTLMVLLAAIVATAFGGGVYFMDTLNRRRHGGFRV